MRFFVCALTAILLFPASVGAQPAPGGSVKAMKFTVLSTMLVGTHPSGGIGEWGFAALLEVDGRRWLIDTGLRAEAVLRNAEELRVDLSTVTDVVLIHNHAGRIWPARSYPARAPSGTDASGVASTGTMPSA
jgi:7,8-dihydropterin-6-yl-methyl-4-(beta-D-ribofuranosyl)aminobenzene 5'-phosphate synthase